MIRRIIFVQSTTGSPEEEPVVVKSKMLFRLLISILLFISVSKSAFAIGDDSTYHRYNPKWTKFFHPRYPDYLRVIDTSIILFHDYDLMQQNFGWFNLGINATPGFRTVYHSQTDCGLKWGMTESVEPYLINPKKLRFYNTVKPYTNLFFTFGGKSEQQLIGTHTQNLGRNGNIGVEFVRQGVPGIYSRQHSDVFDLDVFADMKTKNEHYEISPYIILNRLKWELNGGVTEENVFTDSTLISKDIADVNLNNASASLRNNHYGAYHSYSWGNKYVTKINDTTYQSQFNSSVRLQHHIDYAKYAFGYRDDTLDFPFYNNAQYVFADSTRDTSSYNVLHNEISLRWENAKYIDSTSNIQRKFPLRIYASHDLHQFTYHSSALINEIKSGFEMSSGNIHSRINFYVNANAGLISTGDFEYHINTYIGLTSHTTKSIYLNLQTNRAPPSWTMNHYYSNHYFWNHTFTPASETFAEFVFYDLHDRVKAGAKYVINKDPIYFSATAEPLQYSGTLKGWWIYVSKDFKIGKFHLDNEIQINLLDEKVFSLPTYVGRHSLYFSGNLFKNALGLSTGIEVNYTSDYYAPAFNPAMLTFHQQNNQLLKYYPVADYFLNMKIKSARIFLRVENADQKLFEPGYFTTPAYPAADLNIKFGVSWMFWN